MQDINFAQIFISFLVLLFSLSVHEAAHAWTANRLGDSTARLLGRISLNPAVHIDPVGTVLLPLMAAISGLPLIGWAKPVPVNIMNLRHHRRDFMMVAAAGPVSNVLLAVLATLAVRGMFAAPDSVGGVDVASPLYALLQRAVELNLLLAVFNLIPIPPLDGGNVLAGLLPARLADRFDALRPYGFILLYALMLTGALRVLIGPPYFFLMSLLSLLL